jgi:aspartate/methionine/tyrosine aminotransferase
MPPALRRAVAEAPWLGPREVAEDRPWPLLHIGGNYSAELPAHIVDAAARAAVHPEYPHTRGASALRTAIAERVGSEIGATIDPDRQVLITCGSMQALYLSAIVCTDRSSRGVAPAPSFFYQDLVRLAGAELDWAGDDGEAPDWDSVAQLIQSDTSVLFVNSPCNPTGYVYTWADLERLADITTRSSCWIVSDEAMLSYIYDGREHLSPARLPELRSRTLIVRSFSKMYGMGPWRVGFAVGPEELISAMAKVLQWSVIGVDSVAQAAALAALTGPQAWVTSVVGHLATLRQRATEALNSSGAFSAVLPQAGAVLWARILLDLDEQAMSEALGRTLGIPAVPGHLFGARRPHVRIPYGGEPVDVELLIDRLAHLQPDQLLADRDRLAVPAQTS